jgi:hypothetical protein
MIHKLKQALKRKEKLYVPTNQLRWVKGLFAILVSLNVVKESEIFVCDSFLKDELKGELVRDTKAFMEKRKIKVFICSPSFGTGFSITHGYFDATYGFFYQYPTQPHDIKQQVLD